MALNIQKRFFGGLAIIALALSLVACDSIPLDQPILGGEAVSDSPLVSEVLKALKSNPQTTNLRVKVTADEDVIILRGTVNTADQVNIAEQVAGSVSGVRVVSNHLYAYN